MSTWHAQRRFIHLNRPDGQHFGPAYPDDPDRRFWEKVDRRGACWIWLAGLGRDGYGKYLVHRGRTVVAHRYAWELTHGRRPSGHLLHSCDNRLCVRPDHLREGTQRENIREMDERGRRAVLQRGRRKTPTETVAQILALHADGIGVRTIASRLNLKAPTVRGIVLRYRRSAA